MRSCNALDSQIPENMKGSSDEFSDANIQLVLAVVKKLQEKMETRACVVRRNCVILSLYKFSPKCTETYLTKSLNL